MTNALAALFQFNVWSFAVPAAIISGYWLALRRARQAGLDTGLLESAMEWAVGIGLVISHMVEILLYQQWKLKSEGWVTLFKFWDGLSSYGGFFGGVLVFAVFYQVVKKRTWWAEADVIIQGLVLGWIFGRFGCTMSGDHPGPHTTLPFAYHYADGARHNMGMYEMVFTALVLLPANLILHRRKPPVGSHLALTCLLYGAGRFALDFLRATDRTDSDPRYFGLTLAHYCSMAVFAVGLIALVFARRRCLQPPAPPPAPSTPPAKTD